MARIRTGNPNGRPLKDVQQSGGTVDVHMNIPVDVIDKIKRLKIPSETRKDFIVRMVRELAE